MTLLGLPAYGQGYLIGPGDLLDIRVYEQEDMNTMARASANGDISFPLIGILSVSGMTEHEAEVEIARRLAEKDVLRSPHVTVVIVEHVSNLVSVLGEVESPGRYSLDNGNTVADIIALANGTKETANDVVIVVNGNGRKEVDLDAALRGIESDNSWSLQAGDVVYVPKAEVFYIYGEVREPGAYRLEKGMTVMQALAVGGSLTERGSERRIMIRRFNRETGETTAIDVDLTQRIRSNDVLYVRESLF